MFHLLLNIPEWPLKVFLNSQPESVSFKKVIFPLLSPTKQCLDAVSYLYLRE